jgi:hypothetical protein
VRHPSLGGSAVVAGAFVRVAAVGFGSHLNSCDHISMQCNI